MIEVLVVLVIAVFVLGGLLLAFDTFALGIGLTGLAGQDALKRCQACGRWGLNGAGGVHAHGCPGDAHVWQRALRVSTHRGSRHLH